MKKMTIIVGLLVASIIVFAQRDSLNAGKELRTDSAWYKSYPNSEMIKLQTAEVPSSLKKTLKQPRYTGWEAGTFYRNKKTNEYALQLPPTTAHVTNGNTAGWFRFDQYGKPIADPKK